MISSRRGFSLVEVLVSMAIIGTLVSLLLPAIQSAREAARRTQCASRLRQIAIAANSYHGAHGCFPPGYQGPGEPVEVWPPFEFQFVGHLPYLLPYLEMSTVSDRIAVDLDVRRCDDSWWVDADTYGIAQAQLPVLRCPSAPREQTGAIMLVHYYFEPFPGTVWVSALARNAPGDELLGATDYLGCAGAYGVTDTEWDDYQGVFTDRSMTRMKHIVDGVSQTLLCGETTGARGDVEYPHAWMGGGPLMTAVGLGHQAFQFHSEHPGIVQFGFVDGSVRPLIDEIDHHVLMALGGIADGDVLGSTLQIQD
ncbi:MAG: hypothetical protein CMJ58_06215 [Planctomycetaceae bacterium]|nr:hypothetical protein [Planctomycetaceae bacterium]